MKTQDEINAQIAGLESMKEWLPEYSGFGTPNWGKIDAQIEYLNGSSLEDFDEGNFEEVDEENQIYRGVEDAEDWLHYDGEELFEEE